MKLIKYTYVNQRYYKDNIEVSEDVVKNDLNGWRWEVFNEKGFYNMRQSSLKTQNKSNQVKLNQIEPQIVTPKYSEISFTFCLAKATAALDSGVFWTVPILVTASLASLILSIFS